MFEAGAVWGEAGGVSWELRYCVAGMLGLAVSRESSGLKGGILLAGAIGERGREARTSLDTASGARTRWTARAWCGHWCGMAVRQVTRRSSLARRPPAFAGSVVWSKAREAWAGTRLRPALLQATINGRRGIDPSICAPRERAVTFEIPAPQTKLQ